MKKYLPYLKRGWFTVLAILLLWQTCQVKNLKTEVMETNYEVDSMTMMYDSLHSNMFTMDDYEEMMWKFLEIEELSDKNRVPINQLKLQKKGKLKDD